MLGLCKSGCWLDLMFLKVLKYTGFYNSMILYLRPMSLEKSHVTVWKRGNALDLERAALSDPPEQQLPTSSGLTTSISFLMESLEREQHNHR